MSIGLYLPKKGEVGYNKVKNTGSELLLMLLFFHSICYCQIFSGFSYFFSNPIKFRLRYNLTVFVVFASDIPAYV